MWWSGASSCTVCEVRALFSCGFMLLLLPLSSTALGARNFRVARRKLGALLRHPLGWLVVVRWRPTPPPQRQQQFEQPTHPTRTRRARACVLFFAVQHASDFCACCGCACFSFASSPLCRRVSSTRRRRGPCLVRCSASCACLHIVSRKLARSHVVAFACAASDCLNYLPFTAPRNYLYFYCGICVRASRRCRRRPTPFAIYYKFHTLFAARASE